MKRKFLTNLVLLIALNLLIKPFWIFGIDRVIQNTVGQIEYGHYFVLLNFSLWFNILLDFGITNYNNRNIAQNNQLFDKLLSNTLLIRLLLGIFYAIVTLAVAILFNYNKQQYHLLFFLIINQFLASFVLYLRSYLSGLHFFKTDSIISILDRLIVIIICGIILWTRLFSVTFRIEWFVYIQTFAYMVTAIVSLTLVLLQTKKISLKFDYKFFIILIKQSIPFALLTLFMTSYTRLDAVLLYHLLPDGEAVAGDYAHSFRVLDAFSMFAFLFATLLLPIFSKMIKYKEPVNQLLKLSISLLLIPSLIITIACCFYNNEILNLFYDQTHSSSGLTFSLLMCSFLCITIGYIFGPLLTANGSLKELNIMAIIALIINLLLNFILIPRFQIIGAAISCLVSQLFAAIYQVIVSRKVFNLRFNVQFATSIILFVITILIIFRLSEILITNWLIGLISAMVVSATIAILFKLLNIKDLFKILRYREAEVIN